MDLVIPVKDGITAVKEIKEFDNDALVVIASSSGTQENLKKAIKAELLSLFKSPGNKNSLATWLKSFEERRIAHVYAIFW